MELKYELKLILKLKDAISQSYLYIFYIAASWKKMKAAKERWNCPGYDASPNISGKRAQATPTFYIPVLPGC